MPEPDVAAELAGEYLDRFEQYERDGCKPAFGVATIIEAVVNDPMLAPSVIRRVARAAADSQDRLEDLLLLLARLELAVRGGDVGSPAAYFGTSVKRLYVHKWKLNWRESPGARLRSKQ